MMQVSEITVRYLRRVQVQQFEPAEAEVSLTGHLYDGEDDVVKLATELMTTARATAIAGLSGKAGKSKATVEGKLKVDPKGTKVDIPAGNNADRQAGKVSALADGYADIPADTEAAKEPAKAADVVDDLPAEEPTSKPKKARGRPKGSKNKAAKEPAKEADIPADIPDEVPADGTEKTPTSTAPKTSDVPDDLPADKAPKGSKVIEDATEKVFDGADVPDDLPGEVDTSHDNPAEEDDGVMACDELQLFITGVVGQTSGKLPVATIKACLGKYGADRTSDVAPEDREKVKADIEAALLGI